MFTYFTSGTCSRQIIFEVDEDNNLVCARTRPKFIGGCSGNLQGVARLCEGKNIDEIQALLAGVKCKNNTSCPDQLSRAIAAYKKSLEDVKK